MAFLFAAGAPAALANDPVGINGFRREAILLPVGLRPADLKAADLNGDGLPDFAVSNQGPNDARIRGDVQVFLSDGLGGYQQAPSLEHPQLLRPGAIDMQDVDGNGFIDLVVGDVEGDFVYRFFGDGNGTFLPGDPFLAGFAAPGLPLRITDLAIGAIDADAFRDIAVAATFPFSLDAHMSFLRNLGAMNPGAFASPAPVDIDQITDSSISLIDFDGDGVLDVVAADGNEGPLVVVRGFGNGAFGGTILFEPPGAVVDRFSMADIDGDGDEDALATQNRLGFLVIRNFSVPGDVEFSCFLEGGFCEEFATNLFLDDIATGDIDNDGAVDAVAVGHPPSSGPADFEIAIQRNNDGFGAFVFADRLTLDDQSLSLRAPRLVDIDNDGDLDLALLARPGDETGDPGFLAIF